MMPGRDELTQRLGAIGGLATGWATMYAVGPVDLVRAFIFGVIGCLLGSSLGQRVARSRSSAKSSPVEPTVGEHEASSPDDASPQ